MSSWEGWVPYNNVFWKKKRPPSRSLSYSLLSLVLWIFFWAYFINFLMYRKTQYKQGSGTVYGYGHPLGSWNVSPMGKGDHCICKMTRSCPILSQCRKLFPLYQSVITLVSPKVRFPPPLEGEKALILVCSHTTCLPWISQSTITVCPGLRSDLYSMKFS